MRISDWSSDVCSSDLLAAERLQRRYSSEVTSDRSTFDRLTGTIVRQVGDLRRIVDEFSSFARMPKPVFRSEVIADIRSEERRVGKECVSTCRSRWSA